MEEGRISNIFSFSENLRVIEKGPGETFPFLLKPGYIKNIELTKSSLVQNLFPIVLLSLKIIAFYVFRCWMKSQTYLKLNRFPSQQSRVKMMLLDLQKRINHSGNECQTLLSLISIREDTFEV